MMGDIVIHDDATESEETMVYISIHILEALPSRQITNSLLNDVAFVTSLS